MKYNKINDNDIKYIKSIVDSNQYLLVMKSVVTMDEMN